MRNLNDAIEVFINDFYTRVRKMSETKFKSLVGLYDICLFLFSFQLRKLSHSHESYIVTKIIVRTHLSFNSNLHFCILKIIILYPVVDIEDILKGNFWNCAKVAKLLWDRIIAWELLFFYQVSRGTIAPLFPSLLYPSPPLYPHIDLSPTLSWNITYRDIIWMCKQVKSLIKSKCIEDCNLSEEFDRNWSEILDRTYMFNRKELEVSFKL